MQYGSRAYPVAYTYDYAGRRKTMKTWRNFAGDSGTATTTWNYDTNRGFMASKIYEDGRGTTNGYTPGGRMISRTWARGVGTIYQTNAAGDILAVTYSDGTAAITNELDRAGRRLRVLDGAGERRFAYDAAGRLLSETHSNGPLAGLVLSWSYDGFGRRTNLALTGQPFALSHHYAYDGAGRLTNVSDGTFGAGYSYLANSPLVSQISHRSNSTVRMVTTRQYDYLNRLLSISSVGSTGASPVVDASSTTSFECWYNEANQRTRVTWADGSYWSYEYDGLGQLTSARRYWANHTPVAGQQFEYAYDDIGNRTLVRSGGDESGANLRTAAYGANSLNQYTNREVPAVADITGAAQPWASVTVNEQSAVRQGGYFWKELGLANGGGPVWTNARVVASWGSTNQTNTGQLLWPRASESISYDVDGNTTSDSLWTNRWDGENRLNVSENLTTVAEAGRVRQEWTFDGEGRWVQRILSTWNGGAYVATATNKYVWEGRTLLAILDHTNGLVAAYLRGLDLSGSLGGAGGAGGVVATTLRTSSGAPPTTHFLIYDANANVMGLLNATDGTVSGRYEYDPFGGTIRLTGEAAHLNLLRFSTQLADTDSSSVKYLHRDLRTSFGRWLNRDPIGENGGFHLYASVNNDSINNLDPDGRHPIIIIPILIGLGLFSGCGGNYCDCEGKKVSKAQVETGVIQYEYTETPTGPSPVHWWVEWDGETSDSNGDALTSNKPLGSRKISKPAEFTWDRNDKVRVKPHSIKLSPCDYNFRKLHECLTNEATRRNTTLGGLCWDWKDELVNTCLAKSKGCTAPPWP